MQLASLKYDYVFKEIFFDECARKHFISDLTGIPIQSMKEVQIANPFLHKFRKKQKQGILDIALIMNDDTKIDIELQISPQKYWEARCLFYIAKLFMDELKAG
ncbi:MAG: Rpn family recombination-promoting nuclease/putative transposase, partial [Acetatifactor sp.]|nr:Rpn family recombination-promoting nuclease/putative transposase [Acetatifactor sp.]